MITTSTANYRTIEASEQIFLAGQSIICEPTYREVPALFDVSLRIIGATVTNEFTRTQIQVTVTEVNAEAGTGSNETEPWFNALQKAVITKLSAITGNGSTVFTIV